MTKSKIAADTTVYTVASLVSQFAAVFRGLIVARTLGPSSFGIWNGLSLFMSYSTYSNLGLFVGMTRQYAYFYGKKDLERAKAVRDTAFTFGTASAILVSVVILAVVAWLRESYPPVVVAGVGVMAVAMVLDRVYMYHIGMLRLEKRITTVSVAVVLLAVVYSVAAVVFVLPFGLFALFGATLSAYAVVNAYLIWQMRDSFHVRFDLAEFKRLLPIGLPLDVGDLANTVMVNVGAMVTLLFLSTAELGYYGIGGTFIAVVMQIPSSLAWVITPHLMEKYGETGDVRQLWNYAVTPAIFIAVVLPFLIVEALILLPVMVHYLLPAYAPGVPAITILFFGNFFYAMLSSTGSFLVTLNRQVTLTIVRVISAILTVGFLFVFLSLGMRLEGVALGTSVAYFVVGTTALALVLKHYYHSTAAVAWFILKLYMAFVYAAILFVALQMALPADTQAGDMVFLRTSAIKLLIVAIGYAPVALFASKRCAFLNVDWRRFRSMLAFGRNG